MVQSQLDFGSDPQFWLAARPGRCCPRRVGVHGWDAVWRACPFVGCRHFSDLGRCPVEVRKATWIRPRPKSMSTRPGTFAANAPIANLATLVCRVRVSVKQISHTKPDKCEFHPSALATVMPSTLPCESLVQWGTQMALRWICVLVVCLG